MEPLILYYSQKCPYCQKVVHFLEKVPIKVTLKDTMTNPGAREELIAVGGKSQVPCLVIQGKALYESDEIIQWLKDTS